MIVEYFGFPRSGKTTLLTRIAIKEQIKITRGLSRYKAVYSNVGVNYPGIRSCKWDYVGKYDYKECLLLIDEATLFADNRNYKKFEQYKTDWLMTHGHDKCDMIIFCQACNGIDKKIRDVTEKVAYIRKFLCWSIIVNLPRDIIIPEQTGEVVMGFRKPKLIEALFNTKIFYRPTWYPFFDSWHSYVDRDPVPYEEVDGDPRYSDIVLGKVVRFFRGISAKIRERKITKRQRKEIRRFSRLFFIVKKISSFRFA